MAQRNIQQVVKDYQKIQCWVEFYTQCGNMSKRKVAMNQLGEAWKEMTKKERRAVADEATRKTNQGERAD